MSRVALIGLFTAEIVSAEQAKEAAWGAALSAAPKLFGAATKAIGGLGSAAVKNPGATAGAALLGGGLAHAAGTATMGDKSPTNGLLGPVLNAANKTLDSIVPAVRGSVANQISMPSRALGLGLSTVLPKDSPTLAGVNNFSKNMTDAGKAGFKDVRENLWAAATNNDGKGDAANPSIGQNTTGQRAGVNQQLSQRDQWAGTAGDIAHNVGEAAATTAPFMAGPGAATLGGKALAGVGVLGQAASPSLDTVMDGPVGLQAQGQPQTAAPAAEAAANSAADKQSVATTGDVTPTTNQTAFGKLQELVGNPQKAWELFQQLDPQSKMALVSGLALGGAGLVNHLAGGEGSTSAMLGALGLGVGGAGIYNAMNGGQPWEQVKSWASGLMGTGAQPAAQTNPNAPASPEALPANAATAPNGAESTQAASQAPTQAPAQPETTLDQVAHLANDPVDNQFFNAAQGLMTMDPQHRPAAVAGMMAKLKPDHLKQLATAPAFAAVPFMMGKYLGADKAQVQQFLTENWPQLQAMAKQQASRLPTGPANSASLQNLFNRPGATIPSPAPTTTISRSSTASSSSG